MPAAAPARAPRASGRRAATQQRGAPARADGLAERALCLHLGPGPVDGVVVHATQSRAAGTVSRYGSLGSSGAGSRIRHSGIPAHPAPLRPARRAEAREKRGVLGVADAEAELQRGRVVGRDPGADQPGLRDRFGREPSAEPAAATAAPRTRDELAERPPRAPSRRRGRPAIQTASKRPARTGAARARAACSRGSRAARRRAARAAPPAAPCAVGARRRARSAAPRTPRGPARRRARAARRRRRRRS